MLNYIWLGLMVAAVLIGAATDSLDAVGKAAFERAEYAVMKLALPLAGVMALWLGIMRLAEKAGLIQVMARALRPVMKMAVSRCARRTSRDGLHADEHGGQTSWVFPTRPRRWASGR